MWPQNFIDIASVFYFMKYIVSTCLSLFQICDANKSKGVDAQYIEQSFVHSTTIYEVVVNNKVWSNLGLIGTI